MGIQNHFNSDSFHYLNTKSEVLIDVGIDGLKPFSSSNRVLWPILGSIVGFNEMRPFLIACFSGLKNQKTSMTS